MEPTVARAEAALHDDSSPMSDEPRDNTERGPRVTRASADTPTQPTAKTRDLRLDLFRGIALFLIFVDHIPGNMLSNFTIQSIGFSDAAEIFICISGYTAALVYGRRLLERGMFIATIKILHRVWQLYVAHIFILVIFTALVAYNTLAFEQAGYGKALRAAKFFAEPHIAVIRALELRFQPAFLDILPLYIVLLAAFPLVLLLLRRHAVAALVTSLGIYLAAYAFGLSLHGYPGNHPWFFNPLAWQFLFVIGAACGYARATRREIPAAPTVARRSGGDDPAWGCREQAQLDDPRRLGSDSGNPDNAALANRQNRSRSDTPGAFPGARHRRRPLCAGQREISALEISAADHPMRPAIAS